MTDLDRWFLTQTDLHSNSVISSVLQHLPNKGTLYDVGANVGIVTAAALDAGARVCAFEPHPVYREYLARRCPKAIVFPFALGADFGTKTLYCDRAHNPGWNTFNRAMADPEMSELTVEVAPLDHLEPDHIDVLKIDVEGSEADVIEGAKLTIARTKPVIIMELGWGSLHPDWPGQVSMMEWLFSIGYERVAYEAAGTTDVVLVAA